jgi:HSP20 family protein
MRNLISRDIAPNRDNLLFPLETAFDEFFREFFSSNPISRVKQGGYPKMNASESENELVLTLAVPGMKSEDLELVIDQNNILTVRGKMSVDYQSPEGSKYYIRELRQSAFERSIQLPEYVRGDPKTSMKDGILTLTWETEPKVPKNNVRKINIEPS